MVILNGRTEQDHLLKIILKNKLCVMSILYKNIITHKEKNYEGYNHISWKYADR